MATRINPHGTWKKVKLDPFLCSQYDMSALVSFEELSDYETDDKIHTVVHQSHSHEAQFSQVKKQKKKGEHAGPSKSGRNKIASQAMGGPSVQGKSKSRGKTESTNNKALLIADSASQIPGAFRPDGNQRTDLENESSVLEQIEADSESLGTRNEEKQKTLNRKPSKENRSESTLTASRKRKKKGMVVAGNNVIDIDALEMERWTPGDVPRRTRIDEDGGSCDPDLSDEEKFEIPKKKKKRKKKKGKSSESKKVEMQKTLSKSAQSVGNPEESTGKGQESLKVDMSAWKNLFVPPRVLKALREQGFSSPTPIQALALPSAIRDRKDIIGAAETGSGKTLAFAIPLLHHILQYQARNTAGPRSPSGMGNSQPVATETSHEDNAEACSKPKISLDEVCAQLSDDDIEAMSDLEELSGDEEPTNMDESLQKEFHASKWDTSDSKPLLALILTPTRELAIQVRNHIQAAAKYTGLKVVAIVGGMAPQKQARLLKKCPEIVVATPGRLWELLHDGDPHLSKAPNTPYLVIDEADRMVEKGHFEELSKLLELMNADETKRKARQTFVFSATLTLVHSGPSRLIKKKKKIKLTESQKLEALMAQIGVKEKPKIIDLTVKAKTAGTLTEARITCAKDEKDYYLYYFTQQYPGRTLVFANSKDCIRRLVSVFTLLQCCPLPLHADMHQKQRLKNLDRFKDSPRGLLLATDVAARGLDIPDVQHVIHYQVPRTSENYVHRSGRTARALKEGLSVMLVGPEDLHNYRKIIRTLNRDEELPLFPVEQDHFAGIKARVNLTREIDILEHRVSKIKRQNNWFQKAAEEMDIELDEDQFLHDVGDEQAQAQNNRKIAHLRQTLKAMLTEPLLGKQFSGKYPTKSGKLVMPYLKDQSLGGALTKMKQDHVKNKTLISRSVLRAQKIAQDKKQKRLEKKKNKFKKRSMKAKGML